MAYQDGLLSKTLVIGVIILFIATSITLSVAVDTIEQSSMPTSEGNTLYVGGTGEGNYTSIQDAVNDSEEGDTIFIYNDSSPYIENVYIKEKAINIIGEDTNTTIIDAGGGNTEHSWTMVVSHSSGFTIRNLTLQNCTSIYGTNFAFFSQLSNNMKIINCRIRDSIHGMCLQYCANTYMRNNRFENNSIMNFGITGWLGASSFVNDIDTSNTINGKPIYYLVDDSDVVIDGIDNIGYLGLIDCKNITLKNTTINEPNQQNMLIIQSNKCTITNCNLYNNQQWSISIGFDSDNNIIEDCPIIEGVCFITNNYHIPENNTISNCNLTFGIAFQQSNYNFVNNCNINLTLKKPGVASWIALGDSEYNTISNCTIFTEASEEDKGNRFENLNGIEIQVHPTWESGCNYNTIFNNTFYNFPYSAISIFYKSTYNKIIGNRIINCNNEPSSAGIYISDLEGTNHNIIYKNSFFNNTNSAYSDSDNSWNDSYPFGGNYWDDYEGEDIYCGPKQNIPGSDGLGDTPYNISGYGNNKDWYPLMYLSGENPPIANFSYITDNLTVFFDASSSIDRDGFIVSYEWDFGDGTTGNGMLINHTYSTNGQYTVNFSVTDNDGNQDNVSKTILLNNPPNIPYDPEPEDGATDVDVNADLSWSCSDPDDDDLTYDVYFEANDQTPDELVSSNQSENWFDPSSMEYDTHYYWQIIAWDPYSEYNSSPIWDFTTGSEPNDPPNPPSNPFPQDGATDVDLDADLSWDCGDPDGDSLTYDVYFDTESPPVNKVSDDQTETTFDPGTLEVETTYYWQIIAKDEHGASTVGMVWHFTTRDNNPPDSPIVDGTKRGIPGISYEYSFTSVDPEGHDIAEYIVNWGDGTVEETVIGPFVSGEKAKANHSWDEKGTYTIQAKAKDFYGAESNWSEFKVEIPRIRVTYYSFIQWFLERFPLLERLLSLIRAI